MGGNYVKSVYNQLVEVMEKLDFMEAEHKKDLHEYHRERPGAWVGGNPGGA